jgi:hypothetical protein
MKRNERAAGVPRPRLRAATFLEALLPFVSALRLGRSRPRRNSSVVLNRCRAAQPYRIPDRSRGTSTVKTRYYSMPFRHGRTLQRIALICLIVATPLRRAHAYVDPNSAGLLYQILFPLLVAIASAFGTLKRVVVRLWQRLTRSGATRYEEVGGETDRLP